MIFRLGCVAVTAILITSAASAQGVARPADFDARWQSVLGELVVIPPDALSMDGSRRISLPVTDSAQADAEWFPGSDDSLTPIVHIVERLDDLRPTDRARSHLYVASRPQNRSVSDWLGAARPDPGCGPGLSVLSACQAVHLVRSRPRATAARVGVVGDGFGAQVALAVAALMPDRVAWVVLHEPRPACYRLASGEVTACPDVRQALGEFVRSAGIDALNALAYVDPLVFATDVRCPVYVIAGAADTTTPVSEIEMLYDRMACPRDSLIVQGMGRCPSDRVPGFAAMLDRIDEFGAGWHTSRLTSP